MVQSQTRTYALSYQCVSKLRRPNTQSRRIGSKELIPIHHNKRKSRLARRERQQLPRGKYKATVALRMLLRKNKNNFDLQKLQQLQHRPLSTIAVKGTALQKAVKNPVNKHTPLPASMSQKETNFSFLTTYQREWRFSGKKHV